MLVLRENFLGRIDLVKVIVTIGIELEQYLRATNKYVGHVVVVYIVGVVKTGRVIKHGHVVDMDDPIKTDRAIERGRAIEQDRIVDRGGAIKTGGVDG